MLETMRKNSNSLFMYVLFAGLAAVFALSFGPGSSGFSTAGGGEYAAIVNGEVIPADRYRVAYSREREAITQRFAGAGAGFNTDFLLKGLDNRVIDRLIASVLMKQEAESLGLAVSDEELAEFMSENVFGAEGVTPQVYRDWVRRTFNTTPELYEEDLKADLLGSKVQSLVEDQVTVSDEELESAFRIENNRAQVNFVRFDPNSLGEVPAASEAAINAMIEDKKAELEERYNRDIFKYRVPEERRVRRIVKALPEGADDAAIATLRAELTTLKEQIEGGADFGALATSESDDTESQKDGGDIGFIKRGALPAAIETAVFSLEKDAVSDPLVTDSDIQLVQVVEIKESGNKPFEEVQSEVAQAFLADEKKRELSSEAAQELLSKLSDGLKLESVTISEEEKSKGGDEFKDAVVRVTSPWILKTQDSVPRVGTVDGLVDEIFALSEDEPLLPRVIESNGAFFVMSLAERERPDLEKFEKEKDTLRDTELSKKRSRVLNDWIEHLRSTKTIRLNPQFFSPEEDSNA